MGILQNWLNKLGSTEIEGLDKVLKVELVDETGRLYYKTMSTTDKIKVKAYVDDKGKKLKIVMKKTDIEKIWKD